MIAKILRKMDGPYICSNCRLRIDTIREYCDFCGATFSNYEEIVLKNFKEQLENE